MTPILLAIASFVAIVALFVNVSTNIIIYSFAIIVLGLVGALVGDLLFYVLFNKEKQ